MLTPKFHAKESTQPAENQMINNSPMATWQL